MRGARLGWLFVGVVCSLAWYAAPAVGDDEPRAFIDGTGPGWKTLGEEDFTDVNGDPETWTFDGELIRKDGRFVPRDLQPLNAGLRD